MQPKPGQRYTQPWFKWIGWLFPIVRAVAPTQVSTLHDVGLVMIRCATQGYPKPILEIRVINHLARE